jgi:hypothetical protein
MTYELWDTETGNLVESFTDELDALRAARELIGLNADVYPAMLTLLSVGERGELCTIAEGEDLGARAGLVPDEGARRSR